MLKNGKQHDLMKEFVSLTMFAIKIERRNFTKRRIASSET